MVDVDSHGLKLDTIRDAINRETLFPLIGIVGPEALLWLLEGFLLLNLPVSTIELLVCHPACSVEFVILNKRTEI